MKTRYLTMYCAAIVIGAVLITVPATQAPAATHQGSGPATAAKGSSGDRVERRIKELHAKLKITPEQEDLWNNPENLN